MKAYNPPVFLLVCVLLYFLTGCTLPAQVMSTTMSTNFSNQETFTSQPRLENTPSPLQTKSLLATRSPTSTKILLPTTSTPIPTLSLGDAQNLVADLLTNNAGCRLPCWWGFVPGQTSWIDVHQFLSQLDSNIFVTGRSENLRFANVQIPTPKSVDYATELYQDFTIRDGIIESIKVYNYDLAPAYYLPAFLKAYGQPTGVWIRTFREKERNSQPFLLEVFYENQGILLEYSGGNLIDLGDRLRNCLDGLNSPFIYLWAPEQKMTFEEAIDRFLPTEDLPQPLPLEEATSTDVSTLYETIRDSGTVCIETPKELWP